MEKQIKGKRFHGKILSEILGIKRVLGLSFLGSMRSSDSFSCELKFGMGTLEEKRIEIVLGKKLLVKTKDNWIDNKIIVPNKM